jgi:hypothetical protein
LGSFLERMSELKTLAHDATKSTDDVLLYEAEYAELQEQFKKTVTEEFNEIRLELARDAEPVGRVFK